MFAAPYVCRTRSIVADFAVSEQGESMAGESLSRLRACRCRYVGCRLPIRADRLALMFGCFEGAVLMRSATFARICSSARFFIHICCPCPSARVLYSLFHTHLLFPACPRPLYSLFHTHMLAHALKPPIALGFSYTFARPRLSAPHCTRFFIHIRSSPPVRAPLYSVFHTHSLVPAFPCPIVLAFSYTFTRPRLSPRGAL